jgi:hypothetical protein
VISLWTLLDLLFFTPLVFTIRYSTPNSILSTFVFPQSPIGRTRYDALHCCVRQRDAPGVCTDERRDVDASHMRLILSKMNCQNFTEKILVGGWRRNYMVSTHSA